ncbi:ClbS/DfsB family four-helix bundle protein [Aquimarina litoralis]|uniref:ClbS/DfsB family four-helix bundle protein n=1 Tax=Aquimarina litoralis TaxID=584605 RepID=UPI001C5A17E9|nr:ClbS/DfsB family four-helix bundle protein [Aquimarina litoralis]MBW1297767.1 ClbS/DfsB family four-helix bundle protein [Aquimarina litoralis]
MAIPTNKTALILAIENDYANLKKDLDTIPLELTSIKELDGHAKDTKMNICNVVSYLIGWGELVLSWNQKKERMKEVDFPETGYKWNELGELAQKFYSDYEHLNYKTLLSKLDVTVNEILELVKRKSNSELYQNPWYKEYTLGRMIQLNTSSPYKNARARVRKWKRLKEHS